LNVNYRPGELEDLDFFLPPDSQGATVNLYIHGGFWRSRYKTNFSYITETCVDAGAIVRIVNYALCLDAGLDIIVRQMRVVTAWLWRNAAYQDPTAPHGINLRL
jgi:arylformamidase